MASSANRAGHPNDAPKMEAGKSRAARTAANRGTAANRLAALPRINRRKMTGARATVCVAGRRAEPRKAAKRGHEI